MKNSYYVKLILLLFFLSLIKCKEKKRLYSFSEIYDEIRKYPIKTISVSFAQDSNVIESIKAAKESGIAKAILVGDEDKIRQIAEEINFDLTDTQIINETNKIKAAYTAVKLIHDGKADMLMKGILDTKTFLLSILDKDVGLRTGKDLTVITVIELKKLKRFLILTDTGFIPYPTLSQKVSLIEYTTEIAQALGIETPKVSLIAAVEVVNPKMPETLEAAELVKMNEEGKIKGCIVDGPLSLDLSIDPEAAKIKNAEGRKIVGDADILVYPDLTTANIGAKAMIKFADEENGTILGGTSVPVVVTSRSDTTETKMNAIALAVFLSEKKKRKLN